MNNLKTLRDGCDAQPRISVVVATYNRARFLPNALKSILEQTFSDFEVIIVDDGSGDNTSATVQSFHDTRIRFLQHESNRGVGAAYNTGLYAARGSLLAIFDSDDRAEPRWLELLSSAFDEAPDVGMAWGWIREEYSDGRPSAVMYRNPFKATLPLLLPKMLTWTPGTLGLMFRREVLNEIGGMDEQVGRIADLDFTARFAIASKWTVKVVPHVVLHKLAHDSNISLGDPQRDYQIHQRFVEKHDMTLAHYPCAKAHYLYILGRVAQESGLRESSSHLADAARVCPSNTKYRLYWRLSELHLTQCWKMVEFASRRYAWTRARYRDFRLSR